MLFMQKVAVAVAGLLDQLVDPQVLVAQALVLAPGLLQGHILVLQLGVLHLPQDHPLRLPLAESPIVVVVLLGHHRL